MRFNLPFRLNHINLYAFDTKDGWLILDCAIPALPLNVALVKNITVHGVYWGAHAVKDPGAMARCAREVGGLLARGSLVPKVDVSATAPLARAHRAFAALEQRRVVGKAVVVVSGEEEATRATRGERSVSRL